MPSLDVSVLLQHLLSGRVSSTAACAASGRVCPIAACVACKRVCLAAVCPVSGRVRPTAACAASGWTSLSYRSLCCLFLYFTPACYLWSYLFYIRLWCLDVSFLHQPVPSLAVSGLQHPMLPMDNGHILLYSIQSCSWLLDLSVCLFSSLYCPRGCPTYTSLCFTWSYCICPTGV